MINRKKNVILIFSEDTSTQYLYEAAKKIGYQPIFIYLSEKDIDSSYPYLVLDIFDSDTQNIVNIIENQYGEIFGIVSCIEQLTNKVALIAEAMNINVNNTSTYMTLRDKTLMKSTWLQKNVKTPQMFFGKTIDELTSLTLEFPLIVKPVFGAGSAGVKIVSTEVELINQIKKIIRFNKTVLNKEAAQTSGYLIEEYINGREYSVDTIWINGEPIIDGIMSKGTPVGPNFPDRLYFTEVDLDQKIKSDILSEAHSAAKACQIENGATHIELRLDEKNQPYVIEAALRPGAGGSFYQIFEKTSGEPYYEMLLKSYIPQEIMRIKKYRREWKPMENLFWYNVSYKGQGKIKEIKVGEKLKHEAIDKIFLRKRAGDYIAAEGESFSYLAWITGCFPRDMPKKQYFEFLEEFEKDIQLSFY